MSYLLNDEFAFCAHYSDVFSNHCGMTMNILKAHIYSPCIRCHGERYVDILRLAHSHEQLS
jgi:hypothetical protein